MAFSPVNKVLDFAIAREREATEFYEALAKQTSNPEKKKLLLAYARVEKGHQVKLMVAKNNPAILSESMVDVNVDDYLVETKGGLDLSLKEAFLLAINREKASAELYEEMKKKVSDESLQRLFVKLARQENTHTKKFEELYEEIIEGK